MQRPADTKAITTDFDPNGILRAHTNVHAHRQIQSHTHTNAHIPVNLSLRGPVIEIMHSQAPYPNLNLILTLTLKTLALPPKNKQTYTCINTLLTQKKGRHWTWRGWQETASLLSDCQAEINLGHHLHCNRYPLSSHNNRGEHWPGTLNGGKKEMCRIITEL